MINTYLAASGPSKVDASNAHMELFRDGWVNAKDASVIAEQLRSSNCSAQTPTPSATPTTTPTTTPTATPTAMPSTTPTALPTATPTPEPCEITLFSFSRPEWWNSDSQSWSLPNLRRNWDQIPPGFQCVDTLVENAINATRIRMGKQFSWWYGDDGIFFSLLNPIFGTLSWQAGQNDDWSYWVPEWERDQLVRERNAFCGMKSVIHAVNRAGNHTMQCVAGHIYFDSNCNRVPIDLTGAPVDKNLRVCGNPQVVFGKSSPISLVWREGADSSVDVRFVNFPLVPTTQQSLFTWKASAALPLVVYDPEHTGTITKASQLFGNWTFGGKRIASLSTSIAGSPEPWRDGYEALASLDLDGDGSVRGDELRDLGLWFDGNQNGISEPGEVEKLTSTGVTALFYQADSYNDSTKTLRASVGFERAIAGKSVRGASIDWFGGSSPSATSLVRGLLSTEVSEAADKHEQQRENHERDTDVSARVEANPESVAVEDRSWAGVWAWKLKGEEQKPLPDGYLVLGFTDAKRLAGVSLNPTFLQPAGGKPSTMLSIHNLEGELQGAGESQELSFTLTHQSQKITSTVRRSKGDSKVLEGVSRVTVARNGGTETITYEWIARRKDQK